MNQEFANGTEVKIDQGFGKFTLGVVEGFDSTKHNTLGWRGNYSIRVTGGVNVFGKPAEIGEIRNVLHSNVKSA